MTIRGIAAVAEELDVQQYVLRFWGVQFPEMRPIRRSRHRYYRPEDVELLRGVRELLHVQGFTIAGAQAVLRTRGINFVRAIGRGQVGALDHVDMPGDGIALADLSPEQRDALMSALADSAACRALADRCLAQAKGREAHHD
ncbi:MerR family transcriptional regulator [Methylobacterium sp. E-016]|jgi:DNA-binding transcriptional MerR regulator|uniref:MerR family transcriptional regulator n=1 Tax=Methylobacterium sp. E-016 TaxID=2836556 RepID=UPI001FB98820|nr:MerR family transcriptional regulator [Methylobacterium sp. E-016]MCJ2076551.1 MerR family transcriptional regulator [Methylobacterium sp. E-016]